MTNDPSRLLLVASNRGPVSYERGDDGSLAARRGGGGMVSGLTSGLAAAASSLESAVRANSLREIDGLVQELSEKLQAVSAELRKAG